MINLSGILLSSFLLLCTLGVANKASSLETPTCQVLERLILDLPVSLDELQNHDMESIFSGFNLSFSIEPQLPFVLLSQKMKRLQSEKVSMSGLRNINIPHNQNKLKDSITMTRTDGDQTVVHWGKLTNQRYSLPDNKITVENETAVNCFDSIWMPNSELLLVDCLEKGDSTLTSYFYMVNTTALKTVHRVRDGLVPYFKEVTNRKLEYHSFTNSKHYFIRVYLSQGVDVARQNSTFADILAIDPESLIIQKMGVIDRYVNSDRWLNIIDYKLYNSRFYLLDKYSGVIIVDLTKITESYQRGIHMSENNQGNYQKLAVHSNFIEEDVKIILANSSHIVELTYVYYQSSITKAVHELPPGSTVLDLEFNGQFRIAHVEVPAQSQDRQLESQQTVYIFSQKSKTYLNSYGVIRHQQNPVLTDFNKQSKELLFVSGQEFSSYELNLAVLKVNPIDPNLLHKEVSVTLRAASKDGSKQLQCMISLTIMVLPPDSLAIWPGREKFPEQFSVSSPQRFEIDLNRFMMGANLSYGLMKSNSQLPTNYFLRQNSSKVDWGTKSLDSGPYSLLQIRHYDYLQANQVMVETQKDGMTYALACSFDPNSPSMSCLTENFVSKEIEKMSQMVSTKFRYFWSQDIFIYMSAFLQKEHPNQVSFYYTTDSTSETHSWCGPLVFPAGPEGQIEQIEFVDSNLVVLLKNSKMIKLYLASYSSSDNPMSECFYKTIDSTFMAERGVRMFEPVSMSVSKFHQNILTVQCIDRVLILYLVTKVSTTLDLEVILLKEILLSSAQLASAGEATWKAILTKDSLIMALPPNSLQEFSLSNLYSPANLEKTKRFPMFDYTLQDGFGIDVSDDGELLYLTALGKERTQNSAILVYQTKVPLLFSLFDTVIFDSKIDDLRISAAGVEGDYLAVTYGSELRMLRFFNSPKLVFEGVDKDYPFNLTYTNDPQNRYQYILKSTLHPTKQPFRGERGWRKTLNLREE